MKRFVMAVWAVVLTLPGYARTVTPGGKSLELLFKNSGVETKWIAGQKVNWETGESLGASSRPGTTHCSAYVGSLLKQQGIYILRPPKHPSEDLAKPGHIAFVMPQNRSGSLGLADLLVAQAGHINGVGLPLLRGFEKHRAEVDAWGLRFFAHDRVSP